MQSYKSKNEAQATLQKGWIVLWKAGDVKRTKGLPSNGRNCLQDRCSHQMYKQGNNQPKHRSGIIHYIALMGPELIKKRKTLETGLENLLHTETLKEFSVLLFARLKEIILSLIVSKRRSSRWKKAKLHPMKKQTWLIQTKTSRFFKQKE